MTAHPQDVALLPCPFCGLDVTDDEGCFPLNRERTKWEVRCGNPSCFAHDPCDESRHAAIARWNRRSDAALASAQAREEELRAEGVRIERENREGWKQAAHWRGRAERLAEALRGGMSELEELAREFDSEDNITHDLWAIRNRMLAALSTNAATQTGETK